MTVEQTLKVLEKEAKRYEEEATLGGTPEGVQECKDIAANIRHAIAIIKAAQDVVDNAFAENVTPRLWRKQVYVYKVFEKPMDRLISLIFSPKQVQKKKEEA